MDFDDLKALIRTKNARRLFALGGIVAPILFTLLVIVASLLRPGFSQTYNFVSDLGVGPYAIIQNANYLIFGLLVVGLAVGFYASTKAPRGPALNAGIELISSFGIGVLFACVYTVDYDGGKMLTLTSSLAFLAVIGAQLLIWYGLKNEDKAVWGKYPVYSLVNGLLTLVLFFTLSMAKGSDYQGLAQRIFLAVPWIWVGVTGLKLYSIVNSEIKGEQKPVEK